MSKSITIPEYLLDKEYKDIIYDTADLNFKDFEGCVFVNCNFSACTFVAVTFIDCIFEDCVFTAAKINYVAFRTATFKHCEIKEVNFAMCDKLIFEVHFQNCILDFSKFYTLKIKGTTFSNCSLIAVDFMATNLTGVTFDHCDLYRAEFAKAIANNANFQTSYNYTIDPTQTKLKKAIFSLEQVKGLLFKHDVVVTDL